MIKENWLLEIITVIMVLKGAGSRMPIIGPVDCQKTRTLITRAK